MSLGGGAYSLKLPISYHFVPVEDRHPERADVAQRFSTFLTKENIFTANHDGRAKNTIHNRIPPPTLPITTIPSTLLHFSIKSFDYLLRYLLHGTAKRYNYTQPYGVNGAKGGCTRLHPQGLLPIFDSPPTLDNLRSTLPITQNGQMTPTNNHGHKHYLIFEYLLHSHTASTAPDVGMHQSSSLGLLLILEFRFTHFWQSYVHTPYN